MLSCVKYFVRHTVIFVHKFPKSLTCEVKVAGIFVGTECKKKSHEIVKWEIVGKSCCEEDR